jgi:hypothetical protein
MTFEEALDQKYYISAAILSLLAVMRGVSSVRRVHIIGGGYDGSLLIELLTASGVGTMIHRGVTGYKRIDYVYEQDIESVYQLIRDCGDGFFVPSRQEIKKYIYLYRVLVVDGQIHGVLKIGRPVCSAHSLLIVSPGFRTDREHYAFLKVYRSVVGHVGGEEADREYMPTALFELSQNKKKRMLLEQIEQYSLVEQDRPADDTNVISGT